jgi:hypothetical protein
MLIIELLPAGGRRNEAPAEALLPIEAGGGEPAAQARPDKA